MPENNENEFEKLVREGKINESVIKQQIINKWEKGDENQPVKVTPFEEKPGPQIKGYITQEKYIRGKTPQEMEKILGLPTEKLKDGATIYKLTETPKPEQFQPRGYSQTPGGETYEPGGEYPPGEGVPQWELKQEVPAEVVGKVKYNEVWTGSTKSEDENLELQSMNNESETQSTQGPSNVSNESPVNNSEKDQDYDYYRGYGQ